MKLHKLVTLLLLLCLAACNPDPAPGPEPEGFTLVVHNDFDVLDARYSIFLSDTDGKIRAWRTLPGRDTAHVNIADAQAGAHFDITVVKVTVLVAPGSGVRDTTAVLTTYTNQPSGKHLFLREQYFLKNTELQLDFQNFTTLDSVVVPGALTLEQPQAANNFQGKYQAAHGGDLWVRLLAGGDPVWRYKLFSDVPEGILADAVNVAALPALPSAQVLQLPFQAAWDVAIDRAIDTAARRFLPLGGPQPVPGSAVLYFDGVSVFEAPAVPGEGYRLRLSGIDPVPGTYGLHCDFFSKNLPSALPAPAFDIAPTSLADDRLAGLTSSGAFDLLALVRSHDAGPRLRWEVLLKPLSQGVLTYRLPDVPAELGAAFPALKNYSFGGSVTVRAEAYEALDTYEEVVSKRMSASDPLWQFHAGYLARERVFH